MLVEFSVLQFFHRDSDHGCQNRSRYRDVFQYFHEYLQFGFLFPFRLFNRPFFSKSLSMQVI
nr:MAG TPA: hypothetical protein [Caudoviricetes sp.]